MTDSLTPKVGSLWLPRNKHARLCRVLDIHTTRNEAGEVVKIEYQSEHQFMGQRVVHIDGPTTVRMGIDKYLKSYKGLTGM